MMRTRRDESDASRPIARVPGWRVAGAAWKGIAVFALFAGLFGIVLYASILTLIVTPLDDPASRFALVFVNGFLFLFAVIAYIRLIQPYYIGKEIVIDKQAGKVTGFVYLFPAIKIPAMTRYISTVTKIGMEQFILPGNRSTTKAPCLAIFFNDNRNWRICIDPSNNTWNENNSLSIEEFKSLEKFLARHLLPQEEPESKGDGRKRKSKR
ncbi:MAG: hypothetical protein JW839_04435 [Candidatus Lokiarchaeota archaeon]|nr:hypothetical protein [Candidatus Lokiarchaeota archaeon]